MMNVNPRIICKDCKNEFLLNAVNIEKADVEIRGQQLSLIYFMCPKCNKIYRVLLTDERYEILKEDLERIKEKIRRNYDSNNLKLASVLDKMYNKKLQRLKVHADKLNGKFRGTFEMVYNEKEKYIKYLP